MSCVDIEFEPPLAFLTLSRSHVLNAYNEELLNDLENGLKTIFSDNNIGAYLITGKGTKSFSVGADIDWLKTLNSEDARRISRKGHKICDMIESNTKVAIAAINGYALGGGLEIALACDMRIASTRARLGQPEVTLGITPGFAATQRLPKIIGLAWAKEMLYTGNIIDAEEAFEKGLVNKVVTPRDLIKESEKLGKRITRQSSRAIGLIKDSINQGLHEGVDAGTQFETNAFGSCFEQDDYRNRLEKLRKVVKK